jgi:Pectate lyase superfamily protein
VLTNLFLKTKSIWRDGISRFLGGAIHHATACGLFWLVLANLSMQGVSAEESPNFDAEFRSIPDVLFPRNPAIIDVTQHPYNAKGDGQTDDTEAIQRALYDTMGLRKVVYLPAGTYLISKTINWSNKNSAGNNAWGFNFLQGQNALKTVIKLRDGTFTDDKNPQSMMWCGGFGSADWFHNYIQDITFDIGGDNPGAIGLQFYSNNTGAVRNCRILDESGDGIVGLDLGHRDMNGPLLVRNCEICGFRRGVSTARAVNSQTFERLTLRGQKQFGFENEGQAISIRGLTSENSVPAIQTYGTLCLIDARLTGRDGASGVPAIINYNGGRIHLRDIKTTGYQRALGDVETPDSFAANRIQGVDKLGSQGPNIAEYFSLPATSPFPSAPRSSRLPIKETPNVEVDSPNKWAIVDDFGADPTGNEDSSDAIQKAIDSGARTVFFPGSYSLSKPVKVHGAVRRLRGIGGWIDYNKKSKPDFIIEDGEASVVMIEHFAPINGGIEINSTRTIVLRSLESESVICRTNGEVLFEDVATNSLHFNPGQNVWARQLNVENEGTHITNDGGRLWILGYKTERGGTLLNTKNTGSSEILGGFSYTTTAGKKAPMFVNVQSKVFAFFGEVCYTGDPFSVLIQETRDSQTKEIKRGQGGTTPYMSNPVTKP